MANNSLHKIVILMTSNMTSADVTYLAAVCFTTVGIYFHSMWKNGSLLLIGLVISILGLRSIKTWNKMKRLFIQMIGSFVTGDSVVHWLNSAHPVDPSMVGLRSTKPWNKMGRLFLLMACALMTGACIVRSLDSVRPVAPSVIMFVSWIAAPAVLSIQFFNRQIEPEQRWSGFFLSGIGMLIIAYAASTFYDISIFDLDFLLFIGIGCISGVLWFGFRKLILNSHEDDEDYVLQAFYTFLTFIDLSIVLTFMCLDKRKSPSTYGRHGTKMLNYSV